MYASVLREKWEILAFEHEIGSGCAQGMSTLLVTCLGAASANPDVIGGGTVLTILCAVLAFLLITVSHSHQFLAVTARSLQFNICP